jgi:hypothetical protein
MNGTYLAIQYHSSTSSSESYFANLVPPRLRKGMAKVTGVMPSRRISSEREVITVEVPSGLVGKYPLTLDERINEVKKKLSKMSRVEKWKLVEESFGMWEDYPQDWLDKIRKGILSNNYKMDSSNRPYAIFSR